ncbi:MAG: 50S ribosomal protein L4 [Deltaproteobacteria bacterium]|nr:50S ribosomal protein L4 [Deltaproteobacteria bacterium]MCB9479023.1 50S ribosomal protein L4 [Deltaproteobacteria bacterium]MCB9487769.1 50S ribosomal protein L4 [Deltaproteobacteria bacterium]
MANIDVVNASNEKVGSVDLADEIFEAEVKPHLLWEVVRNQMANRRAGTKKTKSRAEVAYTGSKMYRQKGTGRARAGSRRSGVRVGGGHIFALAPQDWSYKVPKKVRKQALVSALADRKREGKLLVVDDFGLTEIKTKAMAEALAKLGATKALIVVGERNEIIEKSARNIPYVKVLPVAGLNVYDVLKHEHLICTKDAVGLIQERLG